MKGVRKRRRLISIEPYMCNLLLWLRRNDLGRFFYKDIFMQFIIRLNERKIFAVIYATEAVAKRKPEKNSVLNGIRTHDLCDASAVLYQLSYQANWELVILRVRNIPVKDEVTDEYECMKHTFELRVKD